MVNFDLYGVTLEKKALKIGSYSFDKFSFDILDDLIKDQKENLRCIGLKYKDKTSITFFKVNEMVDEEDKDLIYKKESGWFTF